MRAILCLALLLAGPVHADVISEFGGGLKFASSNIFDPGCRSVFVVDAAHSVMFDELGRQKTLPCGGRNPVFIGWPIAWQSPSGAVRFGWFHLSHWRDGEPFNRHPETALNCLCSTWTLNWSRR
jgi:hypothetical protein